jgi:predicted amidophosphoribosyltransferase
MLDRRCPDCQRFTRRLGQGGTCPHCDEPVLFDELTEDGG